MTRTPPMLSLVFLAALCAPGLALAQPSAAQRDAAAKACTPDYHAYCNSVVPGGGRILACLERNQAKLSPPCLQALQALKAAQQPAPDTSPVPDFSVLKQKRGAEAPRFRG